MIIQRDVRVEEALKKQAKEYKAKCRRSATRRWPLSQQGPTARRGGRRSPREVCRSRKGRLP